MFAFKSHGITQFIILKTLDPHTSHNHQPPAKVVSVVHYWYGRLHLLTHSYLPYS